MPLLGIAIVIILIGFFLVRSNHEGLQDAVFTDIISGEGPSLKDIHFLRNSPEDGKKWELKAAKVQSSIDGKLIQFNKFEFKVDSADKFSIGMEGNRADYNKTADEIVFKGALKGLTDKGYRIYTEKIHYKHKEGYLNTDEAIKLTGPFFIVTGKGLFVDLKKGTFKIFSDGKTIIEKGSLGL